MGVEANLKRRRRLTLLAFGLVTIFLFSGFVYGPNGSQRGTFVLMNDETWEAANMAAAEMPESGHNAVLFVGPKWGEEPGNAIALPVLREIVTRYDSMMATDEISEHFESDFNWMVQKETAGTFGFAEAVRAVMNNETPVTTQIGWTGPNFSEAEQSDLNEVLTLLFDYRFEDGSQPYRDVVTYLEQNEEGVWSGRGFLIFGLANATSLFGPDGEYSKSADDVKPYFEEWELMIDEVYREDLTFTGEDVHVWSYLGIDSEINDEVAQTMPLIGVSFLLMTIIVGLYFRDWRDVLASSAGLGLLMGWIFGTQAWLGYPQTQISSMLPILLLALGVDFSFHSLQRWRIIAWNDGEGENERLSAAWRSIRELWPALGLATITTMIAFGTAAFSPIPDLAEWGRLAAIFIPEAYLLLGIFTVVLRSGFAVKSGETQKGFADKMRRMGGLQVRKPIPFLIVLILLTGGALTIGQPDSDFDVHDYLDNDSRMLRSLDITDHTFESRDKGEPGFVFVDSGPDGDLSDPETMMMIDAYMTEIHDRNWTYHNPTIVDLVRWQVQQKATGGLGFSPSILDNESMLPQDPQEMHAVLLDIKANGTMNPYNPTQQVKPPQVTSKAKISDDGEILMMRLPMKVAIAHDWVWMADYKEEFELVMVEMLTFENGETAILTGDSFQRFVYVNAMTDSFQSSIYIAIIACLAVLFLVLRDIRLSLLTIAPVAAVSLWLNAGMNLAGQSLNLVTLQVASLAIGIGLDYAIHVTQAIREQKERRPSERMERWVKGMMGHTGVALFASGLTDILGFAVLLLSVMPMFTMFGKVMIVMVLLAQAACVFILPSLLTLFGGLTKDVQKPSSDQGGGGDAGPIKPIQGLIGIDH